MRYHFSHFPRPFAFPVDLVPPFKRSSVPSRPPSLLSVLQTGGCDAFLLVGIQLLRDSGYSRGAMAVFINSRIR